MALAELITRLEAEAAARVQAIHRRADEAVAAEEAREARAADEEAAQRLASRRAALRAELDGERARARHLARAEALTARRALVERVLARAEDILPEVGASAEYLEALPRHCAEALSYLERLAPHVRCPAPLAPVLERALAGRDDVTLVVDDGVGPGLVAESSDGKVVVDNTLRARLRRREAHLAVALVREVEATAPTSAQRADEAREVRP